VLASALGAAGAAPPALAAPVQRSRALLALVLALLAFAVRVLPLGSLLRIGRES
jgi:hypothetical protein